jgi:hypothetical protein
MPNYLNRQLRDANLDKTKTLAATNTVAYTTDIDLGYGAANFTPENVELEIYIPAIPVSALGDSHTVTTAIYAASTASPTTAIATLAPLTGATAVDPSLAFYLRFRLPSDCPRYVRVGFTNSNADNLSAYTAEVHVMC